MQLIKIPLNPPFLKGDLGRRFFLTLIALGFFLLIFPALSILTPGLSAAAEIDLLLTANLNGRFAAAVEHQEQEDPMLVMAQALFSEQKSRPADLYLDLGNAFYPGLLSRFSYGSIMMDFLEHLDCAASLVSSQDLNIGVSNLEFVSKGKTATLLSANIEKEGRPVFAPWLIRTVQGKTLAFIGLTSESGFLDIAEKKILDVTVTDFDKALETALSRLQDQGVDYPVVLSGRSYAENLALMEKYPAISLCISGGDATGELFTAKAERVDIGAGRSVITLTNPGGYYRLSLDAGEQLTVKALAFREPVSAPVRNARHAEFTSRLAIWKERFAREGETAGISLPGEVVLDDLRIAELLRHRFGVEAAILEKNTITPTTLGGNCTYADILKVTNNEFPIFTYKLTGSELKKVAGDRETLVIAGTDGETLQGYAIEDKRRYRVCSPQSVYDRIAKRLGADIKYSNSWRSLPDEIRDDLKTDQVVMRGDYGYLDDRYRVLTDVYLSNFYDHSSVSRDEEMDTPPGKPGETYRKWGLEDKIDVTVYNRLHKFIFTPYLFYIRQDDEYFQNLLRGTFFYTYNYSPIFKPYHKSQLDTVVKEMDGLRPLLFRETFGVMAETEYVTAKMGLGFEKQTQDPEEDLLTGLETIVGAKYEILKNFIYTMDFDSFIAMEQIDFADQQIRMELTNALSYKMNAFMAVSTKHKWFYFYSLESEDHYRYSQLLLTLDLVTDFKLF